MTSSDQLIRLQTLTANTHCYFEYLPLVLAPVVSLNSISVIAGNTATFTCTITVSNLVDNNDLNVFSLANTTFSPSGGNMNTASQNGHVFIVQCG